MAHRTDHEHESDPTPASPRGALLATALVCVAVFGALFWVLGPGQRGGEGSEDARSTHVTRGAGSFVPEGMSWPSLVIDEARLERERAEQRQEANVPTELHEDPAIQEFMAKVEEINDHQFETDPIPSKTAQQLDADLSVALGGAIERVAPQDFVVLGAPMFERCERGLAEVQGAIARGEMTLEEAKRDVDFERFTTYRRACGNMLRELHARDLIADDGSWRSPRDEALARILQRYRWANLVHLYTQPLAQLTPAEREIFTRWRVESPKAFTLEQRERFLPNLMATFPEYPEGLPLAMFAYERGDAQEAAEILSRYQNQSPDEPAYRVMREALLKELTQ